MSQARPGCRPARPPDLPQVVALHTTYLPHGLFPSLGPGFMRRWHRTFLTGEHGISLVAVEGDAVVGFLVGAAHQRAHVRQVIERERVGLGAHGVLALALRPRVLVRFVRTRGHAYCRRLLRRRPNPRPGPGLPPDVAVITALVVDPSQRRTGTGAALVSCFEDAVHRLGARRAELVTLADEDGASDFYRSLGWSVIEARTTKDGDRVLGMGKDLVPTGTEVDRPVGDTAKEDR